MITNPITRKLKICIVDLTFSLLIEINAIGSPEH